MTSKFFLRFSRLFIPHIVEIMHLGGMLLISYKCLATGSAMLVIVSMFISFTPPSSKGFETSRFISRRLQAATRTLGSVFNSE